MRTKAQIAASRGPVTAIARAAAANAPSKISTRSAPAENQKFPNEPKNSAE